MPDAGTFGLFLTAALVVAVTPGPGIFYVLTRSLKGRRREGVASSFGNAIGGLVHVLAAALGLSAVLMTSATAFTVVKLAGAAYLFYLGVRTLLSQEEDHPAPDAKDGPSRSVEAFYQGITAEILTRRRRCSSWRFCHSS